MDILTYVIILIVLTLSFLFFKNRKLKYSHKWRIKSAKKALKKLKKFENNAQIFAYLRKIDAFVFEEMILIALDIRKDVKIIQSYKYTGDGGVDGEFIWKDGKMEKRVLIQAKRYSSYINKKHLEAFSYIVNLKGADIGLFIHTGKTGKYAKQTLNNCTKIKIISGQKIIDLLFKAKFE